MWDGAYAEATLPARDLDRAKAFYTNALGLTVAFEDPVGVHFMMGGTRFRLFRSAGEASGKHTQLAIIVLDLFKTVQALRARGLTFEEYDGPSVKTQGGIADLGYALAAWFRDSEGNLLGIAQLVSRSGS